MRVPLRLIAVTAVCAALLLAPPTAFGDGDPASDILPLQDVYLPFSPTVSAPVGNALRTLLKRTRAAGYPVKVAVIATPTDLGAVPNLFGQPQRYAVFLASEIAFNSKSPLLIVMPAGFGLDNVAPSAAVALRGLTVPSSGGVDALAKAAIPAVVRLARASGHAVAAPKITGGSSGGGASPAVVFGAPVALLALAGALMTIRRRPVDADEHAETPAAPSEPPLSRR